jgi:hypothetical protein
MPDIKDPGSWPQSYKPIIIDDVHCFLCGAEYVRPEDESPYCPRCAVSGMLVKPGSNGISVANLKAVRKEKS